MTVIHGQPHVLIHRTISPGLSGFGMKSPLYLWMSPNIYRIEYIKCVENFSRRNSKTIPIPRTWLLDFSNRKRVKADQWDWLKYSRPACYQAIAHLWIERDRWFSCSVLIVLSEMYIPCPPCAMFLFTKEVLWRTAGMPYRPWCTSAWPVYCTNIRPYRRGSDKLNMYAKISAGRYVLRPAGAPHTHLSIGGGSSYKCVWSIVSTKKPKNTFRDWKRWFINVN